MGGDAFLELQVRRGHTVVVPDYDQGRGAVVAPYLRVRADGVVERNERSLAAQVNEGRYGGSAGRPAPSGAPPRWRVVARDGRYAWHDHRIHWMLRDRPTAVDERGRVDLGGEDGTWEIPLIVDGAATTARGELVLLDPPSPLPWVALGGAVALGLLAVGVLAERRGTGVPYLAVALVVTGTGLGATAVAAAAWRSAAPTTGPGPASTLLAAAGALAGLAAVLALGRGRRPRAATVALAAAVALLGSWSWSRRTVLDHAVLPTTAPFVVDRAVTAVAAGVALGAAALLVWRPPPPAGPARAGRRQPEASIWAD